MREDADLPLVAALIPHSACEFDVRDSKMCARMLTAITILLSYRVCSALQDDAQLATEKLNNSSIAGRKISVLPAKGGAAAGSGAPDAGFLGHKRPRTGDGKPAEHAHSAPPKLAILHVVPTKADRSCTLALFGISKDVDKNRLWKRVRKTKGAASMSYPVVLPGSENLTCALIKYDTIVHRDAAAKALNGHSLHGGKFVARASEAILTQKDAFTQSRLIIRNLGFDAGAAQIAAAASRLGATLVTSIYVPLKHGAADPASSATADERVDDTVEHEQDEETDDDGSDGGSDGGDDDSEASDGDGDGAATGKKGAAKAAKQSTAPRGPPNRGFAFIEFATRSDAVEALASMNDKKINRRTVAVDWAVPQDQYKIGAAVPAATGEAASAGNAAAAAAADSSKQEEEPAADAGVAADAADADVDMDADDGGDAVDAAEGEGDEAEVEDEDADDNDDGEGDGDNADDDDDADDDGDAGVSVVSGATGRTGATAALGSDPETLGCTLFLRNVAFDCDEKELIAAFRHFGPVHYAKIVMDKETERSKGCAFVKYYTKAGADRALAASGADDEHTSDFRAAVAGESDEQARARQQYANAVDAALLDGGVKVSSRVLLVRRAMSKHEASQLAARKESEGGVGANGKKYDKRHTYLSFEGNIKAGTDAAENMPKSDWQKREEASKTKKKKLESPLFFVSPTRLSIRNLARHIDDATLRQMARDAAAKGMNAGLIDPKEGDPRLMPPPSQHPKLLVTLAKVLRETIPLTGGPKEARARMESDGVTPRSKGFGFVEFTSHVHALACLRELNNNPAYTQHAAGGSAARAKPESDRPRLIVEFAIENMVKMREHEAKKAARMAKEQALSSSGRGRGGAWNSGGSGSGGPGYGRPGSAGPAFGSGGRDSRTGATGGDRMTGVKRGRNESAPGAGAAGAGDAAAGKPARKVDTWKERKLKQQQRAAASGSGAASASADAGHNGTGKPAGRGDGAQAAKPKPQQQQQKTQQKPPQQTKQKPQQQRRGDGADAELDRMLSSSSASGAGAAGQAARRVGKKSARAEDDAHDRLVADYKAKLFGL